MEGRLGLLDRKKSLFYPVLVAVLFDSITTQYKACKHLRFIKASPPQSSYSQPRIHILKKYRNQHMDESCKSQEQDFIHSGNVRKEMNISEPGNCEMSSERFPSSKSSNWKAGAQVHPTRE